MKTTATYIQKNIKLIALLVLLGASGLTFWIWRSYQQKQEGIASNAMFQAIYQFEAGNYDKALQGEGEYAGLVDITQQYKGTKASDLAHLYTGICYLQQANYEQAISYLERYKTSDATLQARAISLIGDAYVEQGLHEKGLKYYLQAARNQHNEAYAPIYWIKAAGVYEFQKSYQEAIRCYEILLKDYPTSRLQPEAKKQLYRLQEKIQHLEQGTPTDQTLN